MNLFIPRVPDATRYNKEQFVGAWMYANGGDHRNAVRVWQVELDKNLKRDLSVPYKPIT